MKKVLIVTRSDDPYSTPAVAQALEARDAMPILLYSDRYPLEVFVSTEHATGQPPQGTLRMGERSVELGDLSAVWYRRFVPGARLPAELGDELAPSVDESRRTLWGTIAALDCFQMDPLVAVRNADHKEQQLVLAADAGLDVPASLFTNDARQARRFHAAHGGRIITKMQHSFAIYRDGIEHVVFTNPVSESDLEALETLRFCPMTFQEVLDKQVELRVTVVGKKVMAAAVDSQQSAAAQFDWRRDGTGLLRDWQPYTLSPQVQSGLLRLTERMGLNYAAADFIVTPQGRCVFLEVNAVGEFFWLEQSPGLPISEAIADVLVGHSERVVGEIPIPGHLRSEGSKPSV